MCRPVTGQISEALVHVKGIPATILDAAGISHPQRLGGGWNVLSLQGKALTPILNNASRAVGGPDERIAWQLFGNRAIRQGDGSCCGCTSPLAPADGSCRTSTMIPARPWTLQQKGQRSATSLWSIWTSIYAPAMLFCPTSHPCAERTKPAIAGYQHYEFIRRLERHANFSQAGVTPVSFTCDGKHVGLAARLGTGRHDGPTCAACR